MTKTKTLKNLERSSKNSIKPIKVKSLKGTKAYDPDDELRDTSGVMEALLECLQQGDHEGFIEILSAHLAVMNRTKLARESGVSIRSIQSIIAGNANPSIKTVCQLFKSMDAVLSE